MINEDKVIKALQECYDPEIGVDIYTLKLIYDITIEENTVIITMTFTSPNCPYGPELVKQIEEKIKEIKNVEEVQVNITFDPPWQPDDEVRAILGV